MADVTVVIGLGFGDEGKGSTVDFLCREKNAKLVVRFNGGAQAAHNVVERDRDGTSRHHTFAQWGAGTLTGARTYLSRFMMVNPLFAFAEGKHLESVGVKDPLRLLTVDEDCLITTPFHVAANRLAELARGDGRHGSCGMGIGETAFDSVSGLEGVRGYMLRLSGLGATLRRLQKRKLDQVMALDFDRTCPAATRELDVLTDPRFIDTCTDAYGEFAGRVQMADESWLKEQLDAPGHIVFEGAQGVLLDENWGFHPHTTWSTCTFENARRLLQGRTPSTEYLGVLRCFATRHGAGPLPTESKEAARFAKDDHNSHAVWQGDFRAGFFDRVLAYYAAERVPEMTGIVLTHMDRLEDKNEVCMMYDVKPGSADWSLYSGMVLTSTDIIGGFRTQNRSGRDVVDLARQEKFNELLKVAAPAYESVSREDFHEIVSGLHCPIVITSSGPTAADKKRVR